MVFQTSLTLALPLVILLHVLRVRGYIPAQPSNYTVQGTNTTILHLQWYTNGSDLEYLTQQSVGPETSNDPVQGILVHFTEDNAGNETTTTPWIAFITCDANSTNSPIEVDVFTTVNDLGAKAAILYSLYSETCVVDPGYQNSALDVYTTQALNASLHIEYEFGQFGPSSESYYGYFNATVLNDAGGAINDTFDLGYPLAPGFLFATLLASNASDPGTLDGSNATTTSTSSGNTGVAMIVLYVITGCVSALFCAVIISGAIRALRYPERYGPRAADPTLGGGQSRAGGLGRAILDTFPVVKFRSSGDDRESTVPRHKDVESGPAFSDASVPPPDSVRLTQLSPTLEDDGDHHGFHEGRISSVAGQEAREDDPITDQAGSSSPNTEEHGTSRPPIPPREFDPMPDSIGRETCPICIVDFEEGDDLRVLPCEGKHRFHQSCVDPWLLELSASCPICRQDFRALETIISGESGSAGPANRNSEASTPTTPNRFSRYLRFARRYQQSRDLEPPFPPEA